MEGKDIVIHSPKELDTVKGQKGDADNPYVTYEVTVDKKPLAYNKPSPTIGYDNKGKKQPLAENELGKVIDITHTPDTKKE